MKRHKYVYEIFLNSKEISKESWLKLIESVSKYIGVFKPWGITLMHDMSSIRYYLVSYYELPSTIDELGEFQLKKININLDDAYTKSSFYMSDVSNNFANIIDKEEIKKNNKVKKLEIKICAISDERILSRSYIYIKKGGELLRKRLLITIPQTLLSIDFNKNSKYFYKKCPKYLDIQKTEHLLRSDSLNALFKVDAFPYLQGDYYLNQGAFDFDKHSVVIGSSGCGKSKFLSLLVSNLSSNIDYKMKYRVVVIDPHSSLENDIGGLDNSKIVDFQTMSSSINLFDNDNENIISGVEMIMSILKNLFNDEYNSKLERVLRHSVHLLLICKKFDFNNLKNIILNSEYRNIFIRELKDILPSSVIDFFLNDFNELKTKSYSEAIAPIISFIDEMELLPVLNSKRSLNETLTSTIKSNFLTLFSFDRVSVGDKIVKTLSSLIMLQIMNLVQSRSIDEHIILIVDEVALIENPVLMSFLSEARKYNLSVILSQQYFGQVSPLLQSSIFANVHNYYVFRTSKSDAEVLVNNISMKLGREDSKKEKIDMLINLNDRECIARISSGGLLYPAIKARTVDFIPVPKKESFEYIEPDIDSSVPCEETPKKKFNISSSVNLTDILLNQSSSRINLGG